MDLILTNRRFSFKHSKSYETSVNDHHHLIYSKLKSTFSNLQGKLVSYVIYRKFSFENFKASVDNALRRSSPDYEYIFKSVLNKNAPKKRK